MKKRTYGTGNFRKLPSGKYQLRYNGHPLKTFEVANDKAAHRALRAWVDELDAKEASGPEFTMSDVFELYLLDHRKREWRRRPRSRRK